MTSVETERPPVPPDAPGAERLLRTPPCGRPVGLDLTPLPQPTNVARRTIRRRHLMHYNRLIVAVLAANVVIAAYGVRSGGWFDGGDLRLALVAAIAQANFVLAVLPRQQWMINVVSRLATRPGHHWPLRVRWTIGKYYHLGGIHVGAAVAGSVWYLVFVVMLGAAVIDGEPGVGLPNVLVSAAIVSLFFAMIVLAMPELRRKYHDMFEISHRFLGWGALALVWCNTILLVDGRSDGPLIGAMITTPAVWLLALTTAGAIWPWLLLRRIPIDVERPSSHVAIVRLDHDTNPGIGTTRPISRTPLVGWHHFGCAPGRAGERGYRMAVSRAGDWTADFIDDPPSHVWVRGVPAAGVANVRRLFRRVVFVATGSGIGPGLSHLLESGPDCRLVWVTRTPEATYGTGLVGEIRTAQPDAIIWNTDERGKPDVLRLAYGAAVEFDAEAVICISNKSVTWKVVEGLERRGIPAFGPIWDS